ncbi:hypothetical protein Bca4012_066463 [Brassica carinata]
MATCVSPPTQDALQSSSSKERKSKKSKLQIKPSEDSEKYRGELFFCHLDNFRMLVGSDLNLFSDDKELDVSLHLWDVSKKGVVKGYEFLYTSEICSVKGSSVDGTLAFRQDAVQQNAHDVLTFIRSNCKDDPGAYWLYRRAGEDVIKLFDLSSKNHTSAEDDNGGTNLTSKMRNYSKFSLGKLLYKLALSVVAEDSIKCTIFLRKCLNILDEHEHMVVCANAHKLFARLVLKNDKEKEADFISEFEKVQVPAPEPEPEPTILILSKQLAIYNVRKAVSSLKWTQLVPASEVVDSKLWNLVLLQGEAQLALGEAYHLEKRLQEAFNSVKQACFTYASMPAKLEGTEFVSLWNFHQQGSFGRNRGCWWVICVFFLPKKPEGELKLKSSKLGNVLENIKRKFSGSTKENTEEAMSGIFKKLKSSVLFGVRENLLDAVQCYDECLSALEKLPGGSKYIQTLNECKGRVHIKIWDLHCKANNFDNAESAYADAILAFKDVPEHKALVQRLNSKLVDLKMLELNNRS